MKTWPARYELLDGLRGLAALAVVLHHLRVFDGGHFAVMIFFVISGYCITASAESCRRNGVGFPQFMFRRIKRIYPPYWFALLFFTLTRAVKAWMGGPNDLHRSVLDWIQNLTLTQWVSNLFHPLSWPGDNPHLFVAAFWSLNYEEQFYLVMGVGLLLATTRRIPMAASVLLLALVGLAWNWSVPGRWICGLFIEYWVHFALGACLYFVLCVAADRRIRAAFAGALLLLGAACSIRLLPWSATTLDDQRSMVEITLLSAFTLGLLWLRPLSSRISRSWVWRPVAALGTISYSLYLIHQFNLNLIATLARRVLPPAAPYTLQIAAMVALHLALATLFWQFCERPFLNKGAAVRPAELEVGAARIARQ